MTVDLEFRGRDQYIASCLLVCGQEIALLDPGPSSTLNILRRKLRDNGVKISDIRTILLTHIHLDHAGATGALVGENPGIRVFVHEQGAAHLIDPTRLLKSASRVFGPKREEYWGSFDPVPARSLNVLTGGEEITLGTRRFEVLYTPGHANHHVSYFERESGVAFVGDVVGIRTSNSFVYPATPPPDIDLQHLNDSSDLIESLQPQRLFLTHFGLMGKVEWHLADFRDRLGRWGEFVRRTLEQPGDDEGRAQQFSKMTGSEASSLLDESDAKWLEESVSSRQNWYGLARYWRRHAASAASGSP